MTYQSFYPATGKLLKTFNELTDDQLRMPNTSWAQVNPAAGAQCSEVASTLSSWLSRGRASGGAAAAPLDAHSGRW